VAKVQENLEVEVEMVGCMYAAKQACVKNAQEEWQGRIAFWDPLQM
jgi:hypothetical protein